MEGNPVWVWLRCYNEHWQEAEEDLRTAFSAAGIADQLVDVIIPSNIQRPVEAKEKVPRQFSSYEGSLLIKVMKTEESAAVLRSGPGPGRLYSGWEFARPPRTGRLENAPLERIPFKTRDHVRVLAWPFEGYHGEVFMVLQHIGQVWVHIIDAISFIALHLDPDEIAREEEDPLRAWYVLYTEPGHEKLLSDRLRKRLLDQRLLYRLFDLVIPAQGQKEIPMIKDGQVRVVHPRLFPGSVFALLSLDDATWDVVRGTPGLTGFVGQGKTPLGYPPAPGPSATQQADAAFPMQPGDRVRIRTGPYHDLHGVVVEVDADHAKLRVMVDFHGQPIQADLDFDQVEKE